MSQSSVKRAFVLALLLLATAAYLGHASRLEAVPARQPLANFPMAIDGWRGAQAPNFDARVLSVLGVDDYINRIYRSPAGTVGLYVGYYESQRQGDSIHSPLNCLPGAGWQPIETGRMTVGTAAGAALRVIEVNRVVVQSGETKQVVVYWYQSHGRAIASEYWGKFYLMVDAVRLNRTDAALIRIVSPVRPDEQSPQPATDRAVNFVRGMAPNLDAYLPN